MNKALLHLLVAAAMALPLTAQTPLPAATTSKIDAGIADVLSRTSAPSASVAVVRNGGLVYAHAYGRARLDPPLAASTEMRYSIGSISKQFTAAAILLLAEQGKLSLDDHVARWLPELTRANEITVRHLLSMTSGYRDFWPQDYVMPGMLESVTAAEILRRWAEKPLDFDPGTKWQYSNTNYVIAGVIVERAAGMPLFDFLRQRIFDRLHMNSVTNTDEAALGPEEPARYLRYALGPLRPAPKEGRGWMFGAGELAMTASDLAKWDISVIDETVLQPASYFELERETLLANGAPTGYALGLNVAVVGGRRRLSHTGEVSGFTSVNEMYLDDREAIVALVNMDATGAPSLIAGRIADALGGSEDDQTKQAVEQARHIFEGLQQGRIDRRMFTSNANAYFTEQAVKDFAESLAPLGAPQSFTQASHALRGGMVLRRFQIVFPAKRLRLTTFTLPDGKLEQYQVAAE